LGLPKALSEEWNSFISLLCENFISLNDEIKDSLCWFKNPKDKTFTVKVRYNHGKKIDLNYRLNGGGSHSRNLKPPSEEKSLYG
jgi:hypothetical protein